MATSSSSNRIQVLPPDVIGRIAAGEVVERPAAIVKELVENSLDAGSCGITIEVADGGRTLIRVSDDGEGIPRADVPLAFERHATSKLRSDKDLWAISTMGFRGEALPSIAAVAHVRLLTARRNEAAGCEAVLRGGQLMNIDEAAVAPGTTVIVSDLFFNTPARRKFLKSAATEFSHICHVVQQAALAWPSIRFSLRHNNQEILDYVPATSTRERVHQIYGSKCLEQMVVVQAAQPGITVEGFTLSPLYARSARNPQDLFVNRRAIRNATIAHAISEAYGAFLVKGRHPLFVLWIGIDPERIDVNVHPTKREIRFSDSETIHRIVRSAIRDAVGGQPHDEVQQRPSAVEPRAFVTPAARSEWPHWSAPAAQGALGLSSGSKAPSDVRQDGLAQSTAQESMSVYKEEATADIRPLGQIHRTFLVAQVGAELQVIDQHTAHERVLYERLYRAWTGRQIVAQPLLIPEPIDLPPHSAALLRRYLPQLEDLGLQIEAFGGNAFLIRSVPAVLGHLEQAGLLQDLLEDLAQWNSVDSLEQRIRPILASLACHSAVRAGRAMELPEIQRLIEEWVAEGYPATCPHGRRVALRLTGDELGRIFGRT